jgi:hypothetical protein
LVHNVELANCKHNAFVFFANMRRAQQKAKEAVAAVTVVETASKQLDAAQVGGWSGWQSVQTVRRRVVGVVGRVCHYIQMQHRWVVRVVGRVSKPIRRSTKRA